MAHDEDYRFVHSTNTFWPCIRDPSESGLQSRWSKLSTTFVMIRKRNRSLFVFALGMFIETGIGIVKEHMLRISQGNKMKTVTKDLGSAAIISFILVLPLAILEALNNSITRENASGLILLFGVMWLLPTVFIVLLRSIIRTVRAGATLMAKPIFLLFKVVSLVLIATVWGWGLIDQLPCFLGVPNCD